ncbi:PREDICTED: CCAAT/enhancer-binding protein zeta-like [Priapulus caudatus]|uniref:CCAAT/enhancer-binding protein zeta-like n=1 Tax=Priapulus caudatus TaxID=37621 RepID=A0ABM1EPT6_PRICU|nr:PREDICTED: CCAAT/enhancer-binding protein zeta-like [Priapulus caudatus]
MRAKKKRGETHWMKTVISSGTLADRMAALTLLLQDAPVHNHITIDMLVGMANKKGRRESIMALDTIRDLVLSELLPDGCKLKCFDQHPLLCLDELSSGNRDVADRRLIIYQFEHQLKQQYANLVETLKKLSFDNLKAVKTKALRTAYDLLINKPEQEKELLSILVNKLGDPDRKVAANCCHLLGQLVDHHPNMKSVVVLEVERVLYRQNISSKAQYYGMCFLNQLVLDRQEGDLASRLISLYFSFFQSIVKKGEVDSKMLSALLTGVNRAFPYTKKNSEKVVEQVNMLYKIVHVSNFNISIQALMLLHQLLDANENLSDRFYTVLYKKLSEPGLKTSSKQMMFLNLVFKSMLKDVVVKRLQAFLKRLLQISAYQAPNFICGVLLLVSELLKKRPGTLSLKAPCSFEDDDEEEKFIDVDIAENEDNPADVKVAAISQPGSDVDDKSPVLPAIEQQEASEKVAQKPNASWVHKRNIQGRVLQLQDYDAYQRNPQYAGAEYTCMWELVKMAHHFHPSVGLFARDVISGKGVSYSGDPLQDFTLIRFLDRFVYRNPKKTNKGETADVMVMRAKKQTRGLGEGKAVPVNTAEFLKRGEANTPVDEQFLYRYFSKKADQKKDLDNVSEGESISDDEFDKLLDKIEPGSRARDDFDMDFASEYSKKLKQLKKQKAEAELSESNDDDDDDDDVDFGEDFMDDFQDSDLDELQKGGAEMEFNEEDVAFSDDDGLFVPKKSSKRDATDGGYPMPSMKKKRKKDENLFAAAEQFASIMDDNAGSKVDTSGSEALANKDKADAKQLKWEMNRHRWEEGRDWKSKKRGMRGARGRQLGKSSRQGHKKVFQNKRK